VTRFNESVGAPLLDKLPLSARVKTPVGGCILL
jgi:hypothetical protein